MTPEERELVDGLFARIRANPPADRDPEAERLIRDAIARDANAAYALVQMTLVQEHALRLADERIRQLEQAAPPPQQSSGRSFLGGMIPSSGQRAGSVPAAGAGAWGRAGAGAAAPPPFPGQAAPPPYAAQAPAGGGGGFLRSAMATAAGVAGGALLFQGISSLFAHNPGPFGGSPAAAATPPAASPWGAAPEPQVADQSGGLGHGGAPDPGQDAGNGQDADQGGGYDQASDTQQDYSDDSFDSGGGGDDWSNT
jgi:hypothetical protein